MLKKISPAPPPPPPAAPSSQVQSTIHQPLYTKVSNYLNNQRRNEQYCDLILELENADTHSYTHFCVVAAQSRFIAERLNLAQSKLQFSIQNPLKVTIKNFGCQQCLETIVDFFYEDVVSITKDHEPHFKKLAKILAVTELLSLFGLLDGGEHEVLEEKAGSDGGNQDGQKAVAAVADDDDIFDDQKSIFKLNNPRSNNSSKINYCIGCDFKCYPVQKMISHMSSCEPAHLTCSLCEVGFLEYRAYDRHIKKHSQDMRKPFFCLQCGVRFVTRAALIAHLPKHSTETPHVCTECGKGFKWKHTLVTHMLVHKEEKQMLCDVCGFSTSHMKALKAHKLQHTGVYFKCTYPDCKHRANRKENLKIHLATHKQEKPFVCEVCGCEFSQSKNLKRHALRHTTEQLGKYKCQLCTFSSYRSDKVKEHTQRVHTERAMQLELTEFVENALENKEDEYDLPMIT